MIKEICVESFEEAKRAVKCGANRVELCENLYVGGTTPSHGTIKLCLEKLSVPTFVMIRPRGGDFCYSDDEIKIMEEDILNCKKLGVKGIVLGVLTSDKQIDYPLLKKLVALAKPMQITFHKAIDELPAPEQEIPKLIDCGIDRILSSGTKDTAIGGESILNKMLQVATNKIIIVVAGRVTYENINEVSKLIPSTEFHGKKIVEY